MAQQKIQGNDHGALSMAENFLEKISSPSLSCKINQVIADIIEVYPRAILVGAIAAAKYIHPPNEPRITYDVDIIIDETDFNQFLEDDIPAPTLLKLETHFKNSDSASHSLKHRKSGIYVDILSLASRPIRKKILRHILQHRPEATNLLRIGDQTIQILKPELLLAMKLSRCTKVPRSERGLCDRIDIIKILKTFHADGKPIDHEMVKAHSTRNEIKCYEGILEDVAREMEDPNEQRRLS